MSAISQGQGATGKQGAPSSSASSVSGARTSLAAQLMCKEFPQGSRSQARDGKAKKPGLSFVLLTTSGTRVRLGQGKSHTDVCSSLEMQGRLPGGLRPKRRFT